MEISTKLGSFGTAFIIDPPCNFTIHLLDFTGGGYLVLTVALRGSRCVFFQGGQDEVDRDASEDHDHCD